MSGGRARAWRSAWFLGFVVTTFFSFDAVLAGQHIDIGAWVSWLGPACLILAIRGLPPRSAAGLAFATSLLPYAAVMHWLYVIVRVHLGGETWLGVLNLLGFSVYHASFTALFAALASWLARERPASPLVLAALWAGCGYLSAVVFSGFPWCTLGNAQQPNAWLMGLVPWVGVYGLTFAVALGGASLAELATGRWRRGVYGLAAVLALHVIGAASIQLQRASDTEDVATVRVAIAQGNIPQDLKWADDFRERTLRIYEELTREAAASGASVVV